MLIVRFELISALVASFPSLLASGLHFLFVMSGAGFTLPNSYIETSDSKLSGRNVPIVKDFSMTLC